MFLTKFSLTNFLVYFLVVNQDECPPTTTTPKAGLGAILDRLAASTAQPPPPPPLPPSGMYGVCKYAHTYFPNPIYFQILFKFRKKLVVV